MRGALVGAIIVAAACGGGTDSRPPPTRSAPISPPIAQPVQAADPAPVEPPPAPEPELPLLGIDGHVDTTQRMLDEHADVTTRLSGGYLDFPRMREGGYGGAFFSIWVNPRRFRDEAAWQRALALIGAVRAVAERAPADAAVCTSAREVEAAFRDGKIAMLMGVEGAHALGTGDPAIAIERVRELHRLGARYMTITWTNDNPLGHASSGEHPELGLTDLGRAVVAEMNRLGIIADVSHVSDQTLFDVLAVSTRPVFASHSSARALADHPRNVTDDMIRRIAEAGGAVCVNYFSQFIDAEYTRRRRRVERAHRDEFRAIESESEHWYERAPRAFELAQRLDPALDPPDVGTVADHLEHIVRIGGPGAACLGSDFDGVQDLPLGLEDASKLGNLRAELERRGLDVRAIFHGNTLRVLEAQDRDREGEP